MDDRTLAAIADELGRAAPSTEPFSRAEAASAEAAAVVAELVDGNSSPRFVRALEAAVEFGYTSALEDIKGGYTESFGYSHRQV